MSVTSGFFNSVNGDRKYTAEQFSELINTLVTDGVFQNVGTAFAVTAEGGNSSNITIGVGRAWFNGVWVYNDALLPMTVRSAELLLNRIDAVVIEINKTESVRSASIRFVTGAPATEPERPVMTHGDGVDQYPLAYIYRAAQIDKVSQADITNMIGTSSCPYINGILETQNIDNIVAQWENEFDGWFDGVQGQLEGDVAANLANQMLILQTKFNDLAKNREIYSDLEDSSGDTITDNNNIAIQGVTSFAGKESSSGIVYTLQEENSFHVGDVLNTLRTDVDPTWLLANGQEVLRSSYTQLSKLLPLSMESGKYNMKEFSSNSQGGAITGALKQGDYYAVCGYETNNSNDYARMFVAYTMDPVNSDWTIVTVFESSTVDPGNSGMRAKTYNLLYRNGYYIMPFSYTDSSAANGYCHYKIARATSLDGPWAITEYFSTKLSSGSAYMYGDIVYGGTRYLIPVARRTNGVYYYYVQHMTNITASSWSTYTVTTSANDGPWHDNYICVAYVKDRVVFFAGDNNGCTAMFTWKESNFSGTKTSKALSTSSATEIIIAKMYVLNNTLIAVGSYNSVPTMYTLNISSSTWYNTAPGRTSLDSMFDSIVTDVTSWNGSMVYAFDGQTFIGINDKTVSASKPTIKIDYMTEVEPNRLFLTEKVNILCGCRKYGSYARPAILVSNNLAFKVPAISLPGTNTYIKALEG